MRTLFAIFVLFIGMLFVPAQAEAQQYRRPPPCYAPNGQRIDPRSRDCQSSRGQSLRHQGAYCESTRNRGLAARCGQPSRPHYAERRYAERRCDSPRCAPQQQRRDNGDFVTGVVVGAILGAALDDDDRRPPPHRHGPHCPRRPH